MKGPCSVGGSAWGSVRVYRYLLVPDEQRRGQPPDAGGAPHTHPRPTDRALHCLAFLHCPQ